MQNDKSDVIAPLYAPLAKHPCRMLKTFFVTELAPATRGLHH